MTYEEAIAYIHSTSWKGSRPGLTRITELLSLLGNPQKELRFVHVAGTNGKGSFCAMLDAILTAAGYRVGLFTSPYIEHFCERIRIDGRDIPKQELAEVTEAVRPFAQSMKDTPTEFELITAIALLYYARKKPDLVILECGMGGRLDSTNVIDAPLLAAITGIALDHTEYLGDTVEKIAAEKAGIIKPGCPVLFGGRDERAAEVIAKTAALRTAPYYRVSPAALQNLRLGPDGADFDCEGHAGIHLSLLGCYQPANAANVIKAVEILRENGLNVPEEALKKGLAGVQWKGRFERLSEQPPVYFDGGHNPEGVRAAVETVKAYFPAEKILLLTGMMADKDYPAMAAAMAEIAERVFTVAPDNSRALDAERLAAVFRSAGVRADSFSDYTAATSAAIAAAKAQNKPLLALGSLYAYGPFKAALKAVLGESPAANPA